MLCPICLEYKDCIYLNPCRHLYCKLCIDQWKEHNNTCPLCRKRITKIWEIKPGLFGSSKSLYILGNLIK